MIEDGLRVQSTPAGELAGAGEEPKPAINENVQHAKDVVVEGAAVINDVGDRVRRAGSSASGFISNNALPLSLMGLGLGWLMLTAGHRERMARARHAGESDLYTSEEGSRTHNGMRRRTREAVDGARGRIQQAANRAGDALGDTRDKMMDRAGEVRSRVTQGASDVRRRAAELGHEAYDQLGRAGSRVREFGAGSPMAVGLLALALGIGTGLLLPTTRRENRLMGDTRDRLLGSARETASQLGRSVQQGAGELKEAMAEQVRA